ncbi:MAG: enoyl-CoA hydratase-related protein [Chloroflexi bacterium]|nr:enoyl-CoA hydratase-related protein [Chloroflexota bacterium]
MAHQYIHADRENGVLTITLDDPTARNAIRPEMVSELLEEFDRFDSEPDDKVLLLTGKDPSFCAGANIRVFNQVIESHGAEGGEPPQLPWGKMEHQLGYKKDAGQAQGSLSGSVLPLRIQEIQKPTIAAINGHAMGLGLGLALSCDVRLASDQAQLSETFVRMGLVPGDGSAWQLPRLIGLSQTFLMQYTGERLDAAEAYRIGLVSRVYPHDELMPNAHELAKRMASGATYAMSLTKYLVNKSMGLDMRESMELAHSAQELARRSEDHKEAVQAFLEKRQPEFKGK